MGLILAHVTNNPAEATVLMSTLEVGGFTSVLFNQYHGMVAIAYVNAMDGFRIMLPQHQIKDAKDYLAVAQPITDFDPIPEKRKLDIAYAVVLTMNPLFPLLLLPPSLQLILVLSWILTMSFMTSESIIWLTFEWAAMFCIIGILAHARYIAVPRIRKNHEP